MPLIHMTDMLNHAYRHGYAVGGFSLVSLDFLEGVLAAAEKCRAPVILNLQDTHADHYDFDLLVTSVVEGARRASVPVAINHDHGTSLDSAMRAIRAGCNGVMVDASGSPLDENLRTTKELVAMARACGVTVEGDLGYVPGMGSEGAEIHHGEIAYTLPAEAKAFVERSGVDCLAVSVGTVHGLVHGTPKLDFARLAKIHEATGIPLVIHGGTGLTDDQFRKLIAHGVAKINYYSALADAAAASIREQLQAHPTGSYTQLTAHVREAISHEAERIMRVWGSGGRAAEVLAQCRLWREVEQVALYNVPEKMNESEVLDIMRRGQEALGAIPGVRSVRTSKSLRTDGRYRYCWVIRFASQEVADHYRADPTHLRFVDKTLRPIAPDLLTIDYMEAE